MQEQNVALSCVHTVPQIRAVRAPNSVQHNNYREHAMRTRAEEEEGCMTVETKTREDMDGKEVDAIDPRLSNAPSSFDVF